MRWVKRGSVDIAGQDLFYLKWLEFQSYGFQRAAPVENVQSHSTAFDIVSAQWFWKE